jgi:mannose-1-phosphate guanylyltransferase
MDYAVIMAGGSGTRLWPVSRQGHPKQALTLVGERSLFQQAVDRITALFPPEKILVVTRAEYAPILSSQTPELPVENFIVEPEGRGTAPAIGLAAIHLAQRDPDAIMAVLTADHYIADHDTFRRILTGACQLAREGHLITMGISPSFPSTGYGYIHQGEWIKRIEGFDAFKVLGFTEKPDLDTASRMVLSGQYSWNSGMFVWRVGQIMAEFERQMPPFFAQLSQLESVLGTDGFDEALRRIWPQVKKQTIDYGVMEGAVDVTVIPVSIGWSDVGSWSSLFDLIPADANGNTVVGPFIGIDTSNTLVFGGKRLIATIGVQDLVIVDTEDALLVCPKGREQEVREIVKKISDNGTHQWL